MPTNQSSPWDGGNVRGCSTAESPSTASKHPKATKVPLSPAFLELPGGKNQAKPLASDAASPVSQPGPMSAPPPAVSAWNQNKTNMQGLSANVPQVSSNTPQKPNGIGSPNPILVAGLKQAAGVVPDKRKESKVGVNGPLNGTMQKYMSLPGSQSGKGLKGRRLQDEGIEPLDWRPFLSVSPLTCKGKPSVQQSDQSVVSVHGSQRGGSAEQVWFCFPNRPGSLCACSTVT